MNSPRFDVNDPLGLIIRVDQMRGLDAELKIIDAEALAESLAQAGLDGAQVAALRQSDLSLDTFIALVQLEMACLRSQGVEPSDFQVATLEYGLQQPTYGYPSEVPGKTADDIALIQIICQNRFTGAYQSLYAAKFRPSAEEALARDVAAANIFLDCARSRGLNPPLDIVGSALDFEAFYAWYATVEADIDCKFVP